MGRISEPPYPVEFTYPDGRVRKGIVKESTPIRIHKWPNGDYATRIEIIKFDDEVDKQVRFAYYRRPKGKKGSKDWNWASQTTWVFNLRITRQAIKDAKRLGLL